MADAERPIPLRVADAGELYVFPTDRFCTESFSVVQTLPFAADAIANRRLLYPVLGRGCEGYPTQKTINRRLDLLYAAWIGVHVSTVGENVTFGWDAGTVDPTRLVDGTDTFPATLEMLHRCTFRPVREDGAFRSAYVESEKKLLADSIRSENANPRRFAHNRVFQIMCEGRSRAYSPLGTEADVASVTPQTMEAEYCRSFGTNGASGMPFCFLYVGTRPAERVREELEVQFGHYRAQTAPPCTFLGPLPKRSDVRRIDESMPVSQGILMIGLRTDVLRFSPGFYATSVANELLGMSPISRLFMTVREKQSLCYSCGSGYYATDGIVLISCGLKNENRERAESEILRQLALLSAGDFTEAEFTAAKQSLVNTYRQVWDSPTNIRNFYYHRVCYGRSETVGEAVAAIERVTREEVTDAFARMTPDTVYFLRGDGNNAGSGDGEEDESDD